MYELELIKLKNTPLFSLSDVSQIVSGKEYAKKLVKRLVMNKRILKIKRNAYTFYEDPFLISTFLVKPSYISGVSALYYHKLITQIPRDIFCFTVKQEKKFHFFEDIYFRHSNFFWGFEMQKYESFTIPIATPEKAIIDSIGITPLSIIEEAFEKIDIEKMIQYLKKIKKSSIIKRAGYLLEKKGYNVYSKLNKYINNKYIVLDPLAKKTGKRDKNWRIIINV
ncbi:hypothetical protein HYW76_05795 [Candidatus Pacearchaeota archaeon]|nr:hypothetical protein [Candidatus Pacearchaeota archaeon]